MKWSAIKKQSGILRPFLLNTVSVLSLFFTAQLFYCGNSVETLSPQKVKSLFANKNLQNLFVDEIHTVNIYLDVSGSMVGYLTETRAKNYQTEKSDYEKLFIPFQAAINSTFENRNISINYFTFCRDTTRIRKFEFIPVATNRETYKKTGYLETLIHLTIPDSTKKGHVNIIITDGEQDLGKGAYGPDYTLIQDKIVDVLRRGGSFYLLFYRSRFLTPKGQFVNRPFYLFILGKEDEISDFVDSLTLQWKKPEHIFKLSQFIREPNIHFGIPSDKIYRVSNSFPKDNLVEIEWLSDRKQEDGIPVTLTSTHFLEILKNSEAVLDVDRKTFPASNGERHFRIDIDEKYIQEKLVYTAMVPLVSPANKGNAHYYRCDFFIKKPGLPEWLNDYSTDDLTDDGSKTLYLRNLIVSIFDAYRKNQSMATFYITLKRG